MKHRGWLGLHTSIWKVASTHVVVDAYTNIYAPLLPLLIPRLDLSLATAGTLAMCFQMANSVSQLAFGALADRWRPRVLVIVGPLLAVTVLSLIGLAASPLMLGVILVLGGLGGAAFHPPAAALVYKLADHRKGLAMSAHLSGGSLGFAGAPLLFAPFIAYMGLAWSPLIVIPGLLALSWTLRQVPEMSRPHAHERSTLKSLAPAAWPLSLLYFTIVLRTATTYGFMTFTPTLLTQQGFSIGEASTAVSLYLFSSGIGGFVGGPLAEGFEFNVALLDKSRRVDEPVAHLRAHADEEDHQHERAHVGTGEPDLPGLELCKTHCEQQPAEPRNGGECIGDRAERQQHGMPKR